MLCSNILFALMNTFLEHCWPPGQRVKRSLIGPSIVIRCLSWVCPASHPVPHDHKARKNSLAGSLKGKGWSVWCWGGPGLECPAFSPWSSTRCLPRSLGSLPRSLPRAHGPSMWAGRRGRGTSVPMFILEQGKDFVRIERSRPREKSFILGMLRLKHPKDI